MKKYVFKVVIEEGNDELWDEITQKGITGCDLVKIELEHALNSLGFYENEVELIKFEIYEGAGW